MGYLYTVVGNVMIKPRLQFCWTALALIGLTFIDIIPARNQAAVSNGRIAFVSEWDGDSEIYTINPDGSDLRQLTFNNSDDDDDPTWSPDGSHIAYRHESNAYIMNVDGSNPVKVENTFDARYLDWSPDGNYLAFSDGIDIVVINLSTLTPTKLTNTWDILDESPTWLPDGTQIAFSSSGDNPVPFALDGFPTMEIYKINRDGSDLVELVDKVGAGLGSLSWTSDNHLIFSRPYLPVVKLSPDGTQPDGYSFNDAIFSYDLGTGRVSILSDPNIDAGGPALSPDETKIAFLHGGDLAIMNRDGSDVTTILTIDDNIRSLDWQPVFVEVAG
jgi:Tol biopolymer transport system component